MADSVQLLADAKANAKQRQWQDSVNKQMIEQNWTMYNQQRVDALNDWNRTNAYNSPQEQMNRFRQAGLNPNLVYGKGADTTASMVRSSQGGGPNLGVPQVKNTPLNNSLLEFAQVRQMQAQTDQTHQVTQNLRVDQILKTLETLGKSIGNESALVDYNVKKKIADDQVRKFLYETDTARTTANRGAIAEANELNANLLDLPTKERQQALKNAGLDERIKEQLLIAGATDIDTKRLDYILKANGFDGSDTFYVKSIIKMMMFGDSNDLISKQVQALKRKLNEKQK